MHDGIDIAPQSEDSWNVYAPAKGIVVQTRTGSYRGDNAYGGAGNFVVIRHDLPMQNVRTGIGVTPIYTFYFHLDSVDNSLVEGKEVPQGASLGRIGNTGYTLGPTGIHLHFELREYARYVSEGATIANPRDFIDFGG